MKTRISKPNETKSRSDNSDHVDNQEVWTTSVREWSCLGKLGETLNQKILGTCRISFGVYKEEFGGLGLDRLADSPSSVRQTLI